MKRREFITLLGAVAAVWPMVARAQQSARVVRMASLSGGSVAGTKERDACFYDGLRKLGWIEGQNIVVERRWASGNTARLPALTSELLALKPDLVMTSGTPSAQTMQRATQSIPIVFNMVSDPVASGVVTSSRAPHREHHRCLEFLSCDDRQAVGTDQNDFGASRFAVLHDPSNVGKQIDVRGLQDNGRLLGVTIEPVPVRNAAGVDAAFAAMASKPPDAMIVLVDGVTLNSKEAILDHVARLRIPAIYQERSFVDDGGLMSYALDYCAHFRRAATYVDKILKGEKPSNLPVEQPTTFELVINLKTARILGLSVPQTLLVAADKLIE